MSRLKKRLYFIKLAYLLGNGVDALWAVALLVPSLFGMFIRRQNFEPDLQTRSIMRIGGSLMMSWTLLLFCAIREPVEQQVVITIEHKN